MMPFFFPNYKNRFGAKPYCPSDTYMHKEDFFKHNDQFSPLQYPLMQNTNEGFESKKETTSNNGRLYNDDLIILGLLFLLYTEKVNDTYLFMALLMLLMS